MEKYLKEAIEQYETCIESGKPFYMDASVLMDIEDYYENHGKDYDAERIMRFAERLHPGNEEILIVKALRLKSIGKWSEAIDIVMGLSDQDNREVRLFWMEHHIARGNPEKPLSLCIEKDLIGLTDEDFDIFLDLSELLLDYGYFPHARILLEKIPQNYTYRNRVEELLAGIFVCYKDYGQAILHAENLVNAAPYDAISWAQLAEIQRNAGHYADSVSSCDYALAIDERNENAMVTKVQSLFEQGLTDEGLDCGLDYMKAMPDNHVIPMCAGEQFYKLGNLKIATECLRLALRNCPLENPDRERILGTIEQCEMEKDGQDPKK